MRVLTWGAERQTVEVLRGVIAKHKCTFIVDVRLAPAPRKNDDTWKPEALKRALGDNYVWIPALGCKTLRASLRSGAPPLYNDLDGGLRRLGKVLGAGPRNPVVLLLGEPEPPGECGRGVLAEQLAAELSGVTVQHLRNAEAQPAPSQGAFL